MSFLPQLASDTPWKWYAPTSNPVLAADQEIVSDWIYHEPFASIDREIISDKPSATGGIVVEHSLDGETVMYSGASSYDTVGLSSHRSFKPMGKFVRYKYKNGSVAQTLFIFEIRRNVAPSQSAMDNVSNAMAMSTFALVVKSVLIAKDTDGLLRTLEQASGRLKTTTLLEAGQGLATDVGLAAIANLLTSLLAKVIAAPSTEAKQDATNTLLTSISNKDFSTAALQSAANVLLTALSNKDYATSAKQDATNTLLTALSNKDISTATLQAAANTLLTTLAAKDFASSAKQDTGNTSLSAIAASLVSILAKIIVAPATEAKQDAANTLLGTLSAKDFSTTAKQDIANTALTNILAKLIATPATEAKQDALVTAVNAVTTKLLSAPSTEAKQDTLNTTAASILAKIIAAPATEAKQDTGNTSLAGILAKLIATPATEAKQDAVITLLTNIYNNGPTVPLPIGTHGNAWNAVAVILNGTSAIIDTGGRSCVSIFGNISVGVTIAVFVGASTSNLYALTTTYALAAGNFGFTLDCGARYVQLKVILAAATITATISAK